MEGDVMPCYPSDKLCDDPVENEKTCDRLFFLEIAPTQSLPTSNIAMRIMLNGESFLKVEG